MKTKAPLHHLIGIFIISTATLLLELALTRVLSVSLWYHFGFLVISTALLGFGAAGVTLSVSRRISTHEPLDRLLAILSLLFALSTIGCFWIMQRIPFDPFSLLSDRVQLAYMPLYYFASTIPFYFSGLVIGLVLTRNSAHVNHLYASDLVGAGVGCAAIALIMPLFGGSGSVVTAALLGAVAAVSFGYRSGKATHLANGIVIISLTFLAVTADSFLPISITANKTNRTKNIEPKYTGWNTFSKVDVFDFAEDTIRNLPRQIAMFIDGGTAVTGIASLEEGVENVIARCREDNAFRMKMTKMRVELAAIGKNKPTVLVIGSGAGDEVLESLVIGSPSVIAVELNPIITRVATEVLPAYWGGLFERPEVKLVIDEGRNYVKRSNEQFDIIVSSHTISNAAVASGALSLSENYVLTKEAFHDYLAHLADDGVLFFTRPEIQLPRLFSTAVEVLRENGSRSPALHLYAYNETGVRDLNEKHKFVAGLILKKSPFTPGEIAHIESLLKPGIKNDVPGATAVLYSPFERHGGTLYEMIASSEDMDILYKAHRTILEPSTDNQPFFNQHIRWSSIRWSDFTEIFTQDNRGRLALEDKPIAEITLLIILIQSTLLAAMLILLPLRKLKLQTRQRGSVWRYLIYFSGLGAGFILIEIAFLQQFNLYIGQPVYTYAVILAGLLIFTGCGSYLSSRLTTSSHWLLFRFAPIMLSILVLSAWLIPQVFQHTLHFSQAWRISIALLLISPLGVLLGIPFPTGLQIIRKDLPILAPWAWGVNGFFTVIGSVSAVILGMMFGFTAVLATAGICYTIACLAIGSSKPGLRKRISAQVTTTAKYQPVD